MKHQLIQTITLILFATVLLGIGRMSRWADSNMREQINVNLFVPSDARKLLLEEKLKLGEVSAADLAFLPRISFNLAKKIVAFRKKEGQVENLSDLKSVRGVGAKTVEMLRMHVVLK